MAIRLADADILPLSYVEYSVYMNQTMQTLQQLDTTNSWLPQFNSIFRSLDHLIHTARHLDSLVVDGGVLRTLTNGVAKNSVHLRALNDQLYQSERCLMYWQGIPGREWYRHVVWVDDLYDGYGSVAFAAVNDALNDGVGIGAALAMANLVIDNLAQCLKPPKWLVRMQQTPDSEPRNPHKPTTKEKLYDRDFNLPASHSRTQDKSTPEYRKKAARRFR
jgi:N-acetylated-alpha-linked acidic dipeptidase